MLKTFSSNPNRGGEFMRKICLFFVILLLTGCNNEYQNMLDLSPGVSQNIIDTFLDDNYHVVDQVNADVNGDGVEDEIYLIGHQEEREKQDTIGLNYYSNQYLLVIDGAIGTPYTVPLKHSGGAFPSLNAGDFNSDGIKDIYISMYSIPTGGVRGMFDIISFKDIVLVY